MIRGSDGLDYEDLTARLCGQPAETPRNRWLAHLSEDYPRQAAYQRILGLPADATARTCTDAFVGAEARAAGKSILAARAARAARAAGKSILAGKSATAIIIDELT